VTKICYFDLVFILFKHKRKQPIWTIICDALKELRELCDKKHAIVDNLKVNIANRFELIALFVFKTTIRRCTGVDRDLRCLEKLINEVG